MRTRSEALKQENGTSKNGRCIHHLRTLSSAGAHRFLLLEIRKYMLGSCFYLIVGALSRQIDSNFLKIFFFFCAHQGTVQMHLSLGSQGDQANLDMVSVTLGKSKVLQ